MHRAESGCKSCKTENSRKYGKTPLPDGLVVGFAVVKFQRVQVDVMEMISSSVTSSVLLVLNVISSGVWRGAM